MRLFKFGMVGAVAASLAVATSAMAAGPSGSTAAPVSGVRTATTLKHASKQSDGSSAAIGYGLAAIVGAGIIAATIEGTDNSSNARPDSQG